MNIMSDFFSSDIWKDIHMRVLATFSLSGIGTIANAIPQSPELNVIYQTKMSNLIEMFTLISYGMSILVAVTVLIRFGIWLKERKK